jgi:hypothetical protein
MATKIQLRRGTSAEWATSNPVLAAGEPGVDLTTGDRRVGDGVRPWANLPTTGAANVMHYGARGDASTDDTAAINACIAANAGKVILFPAGRTYAITADNGDPTDGHGGGIVLGQPGTTLAMRGATVTMKPTSSTHYQLLDVTAADCRVIGGRFVGDVGAHTGSTGEFGHGVSVGAGAHRLTLDDVYVTRCWGDGFFVWEDPADVALRSCVADDNRRQGLSIIDATRPRVIGGAYINTGRTAFTGPAAGIDIEPDAGTERDVTDALVSGVMLSGNVGQGLWTSSNGRTVTAQVVGCRAVGNGSAGFQVDGAGNLTTLVGCSSVGNTGAGFLVSSTVSGGSLKGCEARANTAQGFNIAGDYVAAQSCTASANRENGFVLGGTSDTVALVGCVGSGNGQSGSTAPDFDIYGARAMITGCASAAGNLTNKPGFGFVVRGGALNTKIRATLATGPYGDSSYLDMGTGTSVDIAP